MAARCRELGRIADFIAVVNETEVKLGIVAELEGFERCIVGIIRAPFWYRQMKELDRPVDAKR